MLLLRYLIKIYLAHVICLMLGEILPYLKYLLSHFGSNYVIYHKNLARNHAKVMRSLANES